MGGLLVYQFTAKSLLRLSVKGILEISQHLTKLCTKIQWHCLDTNYIALLFCKTAVIDWLFLFCVVALTRLLGNISHTTKRGSRKRSTCCLGSRPEKRSWPLLQFSVTRCYIYEHWTDDWLTFSLFVEHSVLSRYWSGPLQFSLTFVLYMWRDLVSCCWRCE